MHYFVFIHVPIQEIVLLDLYPCSVLLQHHFNTAIPAVDQPHFYEPTGNFLFHMSFPKAVLFSGKKIVSCASLALQIPGQDVGATKRLQF